MLSDELFESECYFLFSQSQILFQNYRCMLLTQKKKKKKKKMDVNKMWIQTKFKQRKEDETTPNK